MGGESVMGGEQWEVCDGRSKHGSSMCIKYVCGNATFARINPTSSKLCRPYHTELGVHADEHLQEENM
jgi:hypothetical protein